MQKNMWGTRMRPETEEMKKREQEINDRIFHNLLGVPEEKVRCHVFVVEYLGVREILNIKEKLKYYVTALTNINKLDDFTLMSCYVYFNKHKGKKLKDDMSVSAIVDIKSKEIKIDDQLDNIFTNYMNAVKPLKEIIQNKMVINKIRGESTITKIEFKFYTDGKINF
jgi:hypothetical protein